MSLNRTYVKAKMMLTATAIIHLRFVLDCGRRVLDLFHKPYVMAMKRLRMEAGLSQANAVWGAAFVGGAFLAPTIRPYIITDHRRELERQRVEECLQRGEDPFPWLSSKTHFRGAEIPVRNLQGMEGIPEKFGDQMLSVRAYKEKRKDLLKEQEEYKALVAEWEAENKGEIPSEIAARWKPEWGPKEDRQRERTTA